MFFDCENQDFSRKGFYSKTAIAKISECRWIDYSTQPVKVGEWLELAWTGKVC